MEGRLRAKEKRKKRKEENIVRRLERELSLFLKCRLYKVRSTEYTVESWK